MQKDSMISGHRMFHSILQSPGPESRLGLKCRVECRDNPELYELPKHLLEGALTSLAIPSMCGPLAPVESFGERLSFCSDRNRAEL